jgi:2-C-methyl-D-erythritol 2,4-cyclodiphosphate synthase
MRIGIGTDIHRLVVGRKLIIAGVEIPSPVGELAHSDGDVVYHALAESILGALALGDLGTHFPDNDPEYKDIDSAILVRRVVVMMEEKGYEVNNVDISITLEQPKLKSFILTMREKIAELLKVDVDAVSVKAGTNEKLDAIGMGLAVKAESIILLKEKE